MNMKKTIFIIVGMALLSWANTCLSTPVVLAPVGPNPLGYRTTTTTGQLEVFSALVGRIEGDNPTWYQHSDYVICDQNGKRLRSVFNSTGYYAQDPQPITLPPGKYIVKARAKGILWAQIPVVIEAGQVTRIHLDGQWQPPANTPGKEIVNGPVGYAIGWRPEAQ
jgi:hypothetical protein